MKKTFVIIVLLAVIAVPVLARPISPPDASVTSTPVYPVTVNFQDITPSTTGTPHEEPQPGPIATATPQPFPIDESAIKRVTPIGRGVPIGVTQ